MPYVNLKIIKNQVNAEKKKELMSGLTDLIVDIMGRERKYTVITIDEIEGSQWSIGGILIDQNTFNKEINTFINIKVSKGTTNADEMNRMIKATKELVIKILGNSAETNYVIIDELNPEGWGFDGISMMERNNRN